MQYNVDLNLLLIIFTGTVLSVLGIPIILLSIYLNLTFDGVFFNVIFNGKWGG